MMSDLGIETPSARLDGLRATNLNRLQALNVDGFVLDPITMLKLRLDVVTAFLVGDDEDRQINLELAYEAKIGELFDYVEENINRAKLTAGLGGQQLSFGDTR